MEEIFNKFELSITELIIFAKIVEKEIQENNQLFVENTQFYTKSFLVTSCIYLESFLKTLIGSIHDSFQQKLREIKLPQHLVEKCITEKTKGDNKLFELNLDIDSILSGDIYKTMTVFGLFLIDLNSDELFREKKDVIANFIKTRNEIIHHNYVANNISIGDIIRNLNNDILPYAKNITKLTMEKYTN